MIFFYYLEINSKYWIITFKLIGIALRSCIFQTYSNFQYVQDPKTVLTTLPGLESDRKRRSTSARSRAGRRRTASPSPPCAWPRRRSRSHKCRRFSTDFHRRCRRKSIRRRDLSAGGRRWSWKVTFSWQTKSSSCSRSSWRKRCRNNKEGIRLSNTLLWSETIFHEDCFCLELGNKISDWNNNNHTIGQCEFKCVLTAAISRKGNMQ